MELKLRLPEELGAALKASAESRGFSVNAEVTRRVELSFAMEKREDAQRLLINQLTEQLADTQRRSNAQHDLLLQILGKDVVLVRKDQVK